MWRPISNLKLDPEDWERFKDYDLWLSNGYVICKDGSIARIIMNPKPAYVVDHINGDILDNRKFNLRCVTRLENAHNLSLRVDNTSGITGVSWLPRVSRWHVVIKVSGKRKYLGSTKCMFEAACLRKAAELKYWPIEA
jgi:hypothetical protein